MKMKIAILATCAGAVGFAATTGAYAERAHISGTPQLALSTSNPGISLKKNPGISLKNKSHKAQPIFAIGTNGKNGTLMHYTTPVTRLNKAKPIWGIGGHRYR